MSAATDLREDHRRLDAVYRQCKQRAVTAAGGRGTFHSMFATRLRRALVCDEILFAIMQQDNTAPYAAPAAQNLMHSLYQRMIEDPDVTE